MMNTVAVAWRSIFQPAQHMNHPSQCNPLMPVVEHRLKHFALQCQQRVCSPAPHSFEIRRLDLKSGSSMSPLLSWAAVPSPALLLGLSAAPSKGGNCSGAEISHSWASPSPAAKGIWFGEGSLLCQGVGRHPGRWLLGWIPAERIGLMWLGSHRSIKGVAGITEPCAGVFLLLHNSKWNK